LKNRISRLFLSLSLGLGARRYRTSWSASVSNATIHYSPQRAPSRLLSLVLFLNLAPLPARPRPPPDIPPPNDIRPSDPDRHVLLANLELISSGATTRATREHPAGTTWLTFARLRERGISEDFPLPAPPGSVAPVSRMIARSIRAAVSARPDFLPARAWFNLVERVRRDDSSRIAKVTRIRCRYERRLRLIRCSKAGFVRNSSRGERSRIGKGQTSELRNRVPKG